MSKIDIKELRLLVSLAWMYEQYCGDNYGHNFMGAGEDAIEILESYGLGNEVDGINDKKLDKLEKQLYKLESNPKKEEKR